MRKEIDMKKIYTIYVLTDNSRFKKDFNLQMHMSFFIQLLDLLNEIFLCVKSFKKEKFGSFLNQVLFVI